LFLKSSHGRLGRAVGKRKGLILFFSLLPFLKQLREGKDELQEAQSPWSHLMLIAWNFTMHGHNHQEDQKQKLQTENVGKKKLAK
jgi:hypothetical protein